MRFIDLSDEVSDILNELSVIENINTCASDGLVSFMFKDMDSKVIEISDDFEDFEDFIAKMRTVDYTFIDTLSAENQQQWERLISHFEDISFLVDFDDDVVMYNAYLSQIAVKLDKLMQEFDLYEYRDQDDGNMLDYIEDLLKNDASPILDFLNEDDFEDELKKDVDSMKIKIKYGIDCGVFYQKEDCLTL